MPRRASTKKAPADGAACACAAGPDTSIGPGGHAAAVDPAIKDANLKHLRRIEGQVRGIAGMIEEDRYCADIITQVAAVRESLHSVARNLMRNHLAHCAAQALHEEGSERERMVDELLDLVSKIAR
jgi:CsoR family transcriptional regulator, copper-sensing transcriptional repressor